MSSIPGQTSFVDHTTAQGQSLVDVDGVREGVASRLNVVLQQSRTTLDSISADAAPLIEAWQELVSGGKRLRAAFAYWGYRSISPEQELDGATSAALFQVGAALELFQAAALFHDDVMDRSDTRRGHPTAHKAFESAHARSGFVGDAEQYGINTAILLGDLSLVESEAEFRRASSHFATEYAAKAHELFDTMRTTVTVGQFLDVHAQVLPWSTNLNAARDRAFEIIKTKTSSYSVTLPLLIGAALAGATPEQLDALEKYGLPVGIAYQLFDDILGAFGDASTTGKPIGDDLREGKRTVLVIEAMMTLEEPDRVLLMESLGRADLSDSEVSNLLSLIESSGAIERTTQSIEELAAQGLANLDAPFFQPFGAQMLRKITAYSLKREY